MRVVDLSGQPGVKHDDGVGPGGSSSGMPFGSALVSPMKNIAMLASPNVMPKR